MPAPRSDGDREADRPTVRAFFALWPHEPVRRGLFAWAQACHGAAGGRLVRRENLHVTLAFLGEVERSRLPELAALVEGLRKARFTLQLDRLGYWPHNGIVYAGAAAMPETLAALAATLAQALAGARFRSEERPYFAHVTLLRAARREPSGVRIEPLRWEVDGIALVESAHADGRVVYRPLQRWTLTD